LPGQSICQSNCQSILVLFRSLAPGMHPTANVRDRTSPSQ
jgi:hypothetical protein